MVRLPYVRLQVMCHPGAGGGTAGGGEGHERRTLGSGGGPDWGLRGVGGCSNEGRRSGGLKEALYCQSLPSAA